jgi:hypothetical protein
MLSIDYRARSRFDYRAHPPSLRDSSWSGVLFRDSQERLRAVPLEETRDRPSRGSKRAVNKPGREAAVDGERGLDWNRIDVFGRRGRRDVFSEALAWPCPDEPGGRLVALQRPLHLSRSKFIIPS